MNVVEVHPPLYKRGVKGEVRVWWAELGQLGDDWGYRSISGIVDGEKVTAGWTVCVPKNVGRSNETSREAQARAEIASEYTKKTDRSYFPDIKQIDNVVFREPMLATKWPDRRAKVRLADGVFSQPKLDGIRNITRADGLWSRKGKPITACPHVSEILTPLFERDPDLILDGELYNHEFRDDFNTITSIVRKTKHRPDDLEKSRNLIQYHVYDMVGDEPFEDRFRKLSELINSLPGNDGTIVLVETEKVVSDEQLDAAYGDYLLNRFEGQMIRLNQPYEFKRSNNLIKRKEFDTDEFPVVAVYGGIGNWSGCVKGFTVQLPDGRTNDAGVRGTQEQMRKMFETNQKPDWATVRYQGLTPDGKLRFPVVVDYGFGTRDD